MKNFQKIKYKWSIIVRWSFSPGIGECTDQNGFEVPSHPVRKATIRKQKAANTDEDVNKRTPFHTAGGKVRQSSYHGNQPQVFQIKRPTVCSSHPSPGHVAGGPQASRAEMLAHKGLLQLSSQSLSYDFKLDVQPQRRGQGDVVDVRSGTALIPKKKSHATCRKMNTPADTISE